MTNHVDHQLLNDLFYGLSKLCSLHHVHNVVFNLAAISTIDNTFAKSGYKEFIQDQKERIC